MRRSVVTGRGTAAAAAILALAALAALSGCAQTGTPHPSESQASTATAAPAADATAKSLTPPIACDTLTTADAVRALVGGTGDPQTLTDLAPNHAVADPWLLGAANGSFCAWGGVQALREESGQWDPSVIVELLPHAGDVWSTLATASSPSAGARYSGGSSLGGGCGTETPPVSCTTNVLVGDIWLAVSARDTHGISEQVFHDYVQGIVTRVATMPTPSAPPALKVRPACDDPALTAKIASAYGVKAITVDSSDNPFTIADAAERLTSASSCHYDTVNHQGWNLEITRLSNAAGVSQTAAASFSGVARIPLALDGSNATATAWQHETADSTMNVVDVLSNGTWLQVFFWGDQTEQTAALARTLAAGV